MLLEDPKRRPNIYQVVKETCSMRGTQVPIKDVCYLRLLYLFSGPLLTIIDIRG